MLHLPPSQVAVDTDEDYQKKLEYMKLLEEKVLRQKLLPHLYGWKFYKWAKAYFESTNRIRLICAANQISKSSTQIRSHIDWATNLDLWPKLWRTTPKIFWYLYPTRDVAHVEFMKKWVPEFMPRGEYKDHPQYGWKQELYHGRIFAIHWNSGVSTYFKTYAQDVQDLQSSTSYLTSVDEEPPEEIMTEIFFRLAATEGYLSAVFTATLGQEYWREAIEEKGAKERFKGAFKTQVSMYDCLKYDDGSDSHWTVEKIQEQEARCRSAQEIDMRVNGRFVKVDGLKYPSFHRTFNRKKGHPIPKDWSIWCGVDYGSGGADNHPSAITFIGVSPDWKQARVFKGWRGDDVVTTAGDVVNKVIEMSEGLDYVRIYYDSGCRDFYTIATSIGLHVEPAEKSHVIGETILNVLFKNRLLLIYEDPELDKLAIELTSIRSNQDKRRAKDDFIDSLRYACAKVPWNFDDLKIELHPTPEAKAKTLKELEIEERRKWMKPADDGLISCEQEMDQFNDLMGYGDE